MIVRTVCGCRIDHNHFPVLALLLDPCDGDSLGNFQLHTLHTYTYLIILLNAAYNHRVMNRQTSSDLRIA